MMKRRAIYFLLLVLCLFLLSACNKKEKQTPQTDEKAASILDEKMDSFTGQDFQTIAESSTMQLQLQPDLGTIRWKSKTDESYYDTKLFEGTSKNITSDMKLTYYSGLPNNPYGTITEMPTYSMSVEAGKVSYQKMDNGIRVIYDMGDDQITYKNFPKYIDTDRLEELVLKHCDEAQKRIVEKSYTLSKGKTWARNSNKDAPIRNLAAKELYKLFYEVGKYTYEDLLMDNESYEVDMVEETPANYSVVFPVEFTLEGEELKVCVPVKDIEVSDETKPLASLDFLPYFMSTESTDGFMFIPDGSGTLIDLKNNKLNETQFTSRFYGGDKLIDTDTYKEAQIKMMMPVFGMKTDNHAIFAIVEEGAENATLSTYVKGSYQDEPFSRMSLNFQIREKQKVKSSARANAKEYSTTEVTDDAYTNDFIVRYQYLSKENASYSGMAAYYASYLEEKGVLTKKEEEDQAPFYLELLGATDKKKFRAGFSYNGVEVLTSFKQAEEILTSLNDSGVKNVKLIYSGMVNHGMNQRPAEKVSVISELGGKKGLKSLQKHAENLGASVFPNLKMQTAYTKKGLSSNQISYFISNEKAVLYNFDLMTRTIDKITFPFSKYMINPSYMSTYIKKMMKSYSSLGVSNIASDDFMTFLPATYQKEKNVSQTTAKTYMDEAMKSIPEETGLMLSNPLDLAYSYADYLVDMPTQNSGLRIHDNSIPFMQMVLSGHMSYASTNINKDSLDVADDVLRAVEGKNALKFSFLAADQENLNNTMQNDHFAGQFSVWKDEIGKIYTQYNEFYQKVKNAVITNHEILDDAGLLRVVEYSNGAKVYLNYGDEEVPVSGVTVAAHSFVVK